MGVLSDLALGSVIQVEQRLGKRAALRTLVPLLDTLSPEARSAAMVKALRYATELNDVAQRDALANRWAAEDRGRHGDIRNAVREMLGGRRPGTATVLARAEVARAEGRYEEASARYLLARCLERTSATEALAEYERAARTAAKQPRLRAAIEVRAIRQLLRLGARHEAARRAAALVPLEDRADPRDRLAVAVAALGARGRYKRVGALDELLDLTSNPALRERATDFVLLHAESAGQTLSDIELDRIEAILSLDDDLERRERRRARVRLLASPHPKEGALHGDAAAERFLPRARAVLAGHPPGPRPTREGELPSREEIGWLGLSVLHALRSDRPVDAARFLGEAARSLGRGARREAVLFTAVIAGWEAAPVASRELAAALVAGMGEPPMGGYLELAACMRDEEDEALLEATLRHAAQRREPGAAGHLGALLRRSGWLAAAAGRNEEAVGLLTEARRWLRP